MVSKVVVFGTGSAAKDFLSVVPGGLEIAAFSDNDPAKHGTTLGQHAIVHPDRLGEMAYDYVVIASRAVDAIRADLLRAGVPGEKIVAYYPSFSQTLHDAANRDARILNSLGLTIPPVGLATMYLDEGGGEGLFDRPRDFVRDQAFRLAARRVRERGVPGAIGELGVYQGDQARLLNGLFPDRPLYLFDTFEGFAERDLGAEAEQAFSTAALGDFAGTSIDAVMAKLPHPEQARVRQGYFPDTTAGIDERFAFASLDVDLYAPTVAGLAWFYDRLNPGGYIFVHDYNNQRYRGVRKAVDAFVEQRGACCFPLPDFAGSIILTR